MERIKNKEDNHNKDKENHQYLNQNNSLNFIK